MHRMPRHRLLLIIFVGLSAAVTSRAAGQVIAWESFESYTAGSNLNGSSGGFGWGLNNWVTTSSGVGPLPDVTVQTISLMPPLGGTQAARVEPAVSVAADNNQIMRRDFAAFSGNVSVADNPVYFAVLLRHDYNAIDDFLQIQLTDGSVGNAANTLSMGLHNTSASKPIFARVGTSSTGTTAVDGTAAPNTDHLLIGRLSKVGGQFERIDLFVDQFSQGVANATAIDNEPTLTAFTRFNVRINNVENVDTAFIDQIAIAGTFDQLFPQLTTTPNSSLTAAFGNTRVGTSGAQTLTAQNTGSFTLTSLSFNDPSNSLFARVGAQAGSNLITNATDNRTYNFSPTARGAASGSVTVTGNRGTPVSDPNQVVTSNIGLTGTGVGPVFAYTINDFSPSPRSGTPLPSGGNNGNVALATGETINLGTASANGTTTAQLTLANVTPDGDLGTLTDLTILSGLISGADAAQFQLFEIDGITPYTGGDVLGAGDTLDLIVQFAGDPSTAYGFKSALLTFTTDQGAPLTSAGGTFTFDLLAQQVPEPTTPLLWGLLAVACIATGLLRTAKRGRD